MMELTFSKKRLLNIVALLIGLLFHPECEMLLRKKTKGNNDYGRKYFGDGRIKMKILNHYIQQYIVKKKIDNYYQHVPEELGIPLQVRSAKYKVFV